MSIIDAFDNQTEAIINPKDVSPQVEGFPEIAVAVFEQHMINVLKGSYMPEQIDRMFAGEPIPIYKVMFRDKNIAFYRTVCGGAASAALLEEMLSKGCKKLLFFGTCGVLDKEISANSLIVPTAAYRDEGTSYHYVPASDYIDVRSAAKLAEVLEDIGVPYVSGKTWTTDAIYRETRGNMKKRKSDGCIAVEMECASIMAVAQFRNAEVYQFLYAADSLDDIRWDPRTLLNKPKDARERLVRIALEVAARI